MPYPLLILTSFLSLLLVTASPAAGQIGHDRVARFAPVRETGYEIWQTSWDTAQRLADQTDRPLMLVFTRGDRAPACRQLSESVFHTPEFARWSSERVVKLEIDLAPPIDLPPAWQRQNAELWERYRDHINELPTVLFVHPDGRVLGKMPYRHSGVERWIGEAEMTLPIRVLPGDRRG